MFGYIMLFQLSGGKERGERREERERERERARE